MTRSPGKKLFYELRNNQMTVLIDKKDIFYKKLFIYLFI